MEGDESARAVAIAAIIATTDDERRELIQKAVRLHQEEEELAKRYEEDTGVSAQEKQEIVWDAEAAITLEKQAWANTGKVGYLSKVEKGGLLSGKKVKKLFFMLRMIQSDLQIYVTSNAAGLDGEPKGSPKAVYKFSRQLTCIPIDDPKHPLGAYAFELSDPRSGKLELGCDSEEERQKWITAFKHAADGFKASSTAEEALKKAQDLQVTKADIELSSEAREQLVKIESLFETGLLSRLEMDQLKPIFMQPSRNT